MIKIEDAFVGDDVDVIKPKCALARPSICCFNGSLWVFDADKYSTGTSNYAVNIL